MELINGLYLYEVVLLVLGVMLFLVLLFAFSVLVIRGRPFGKLLSFFMLPIVMVGYPSIESIEFGDNMLRLTMQMHELEKDPTNSNIRKSVESQLDEVSGRVVVKAETNIELARAELALGKEAVAKEKIDKVLRSSPQQLAAIELKKQIDLKRDVSDLVARVERNPDDAAAKRQLAVSTDKLTSMKIANPTTIATIAKAQAALGEEDKARTTVNKALVINPGLTPAIDLRNRLER